MAEHITQNHNNVQHDNIKKTFKLHDYPMAGITRERSFVRMPSLQNQQNMNKRRSLAFNQQQQHQQIRGKPALEIYRPPSIYKIKTLFPYTFCILIQEDPFIDVRIDGPHNKLNVHAQEFTMGRDQMPTSRSTIAVFPGHGSPMLQHSKSSGNMQHQFQLASARQHANHMANMASRAILVSHPMQLGPIGVGIAMQSSQMPLINSPSAGNILHVMYTVLFVVSRKNMNRISIACSHSIQHKG